MTEIRKTYRISQGQFKRLLRLRDVMSKAAGQKVGWQLVLSTTIEAGLKVLGYAEGGADSGRGAE